MEERKLFQMARNLKEKSVGMWYHMKMSDGWRVGWPEQRTVEGETVDGGGDAVASGSVLNKACYLLSMCF